MKVVRLNKLTVKDFKGQSFESVFNGEHTAIKGHNGVGKTTHLKAVLFLFTSYVDAVSPKNHEIFNNKEKLSHLSPTASVCAEIDIDGVIYKLEKQAKASFSRKSGEEEYTKDPSDKYKIYINDLELNASKFKIWTEENLCPQDMLPYLMCGEFFANLALDDKDSARKIIESIVGEILPSDFKGDYSDLLEQMKRHSIDELKAQTRTRINDANKNITLSNDRIKQQEVYIAELAANNFEAIECEVNELKCQIAEIDNEIGELSESIKPLLDKRNKELAEVSDLLANLHNKSNEYTAKQYEPIRELELTLKNIEGENERIAKENDEIKDAIYYNNYRRNNYKVQLEHEKSYIEKVRNELRNVKASVFDSTNCAYCGQELPTETLAEELEKFNARKESEVKRLTIAGKESKARIEEHESQIAKLDESLLSQPKPKELLSKDAILSQIADAKSKLVPYEQTSEYESLKTEIELKKANVTIVEPIDTTSYTERKKPIMELLSEKERILGRRTILDSNKLKLAEMHEAHKANVSEVARLQRLENQIKEYIEEKAKIASERVNGKLKSSYIVTESIQKNGMKRPDCVICDSNGVKYSTLNGGARILTQVDMQRLFCKHYKISMPIWIDECAALDLDKRPLFDDAQCIQIIRDDCELKLERL